MNCHVLPADQTGQAFNLHHEPPCSVYLACPPVLPLRPQWARSCVLILNSVMAGTEALQKLLQCHVNHPELKNFKASQADPDGV